MTIRKMTASVSVAIKNIEQADWKPEVWDKQILYLYKSFAINDINTGTHERQ